MKKLNILFLTALLSITSLFLSNPNASAASNINDPALKTEYQNLVNQGVIDHSLDYNTWATTYIEGQIIDEETQKEVESNVHTAAGKAQVVSPAYTAMKAGDIFVTNDSYGNGLAGHAAIAISSTAILQMTGAGHSSEILSYGDWKEKYKKKNKVTWIYRHENSAVAQAAADWARIHYWNSNGGGGRNLTPKYWLTTSLTNYDPSYCSKLVFQAYYETSPTYIKKPMSKIVSPYYLRAQPAQTKPYATVSLWKIEPKLISTITNYK